ncbi:TetR family transcriptional regulator [Aeromicrobium sp. CF3.5]|uniref:TetR/AcrR family transcriptional regulator n=1 Tax=Aeromicrobium sp. CF3.5 TaxID=3373078 RepID=UPI003EE7E8F9
MSSKDLIAEQAVHLFETEGYASTTVRRIASAAGVDPAMVIRHFGSKEALFLEVVGLDGFGETPIDGPIEELGERLVAHSVDPERADFRSHLAAMVRASDREVVREGLRDASRRVFVDRLAAVLEGDDAMLRAHLVSAQLGGLFQAWAVVEEEGIIGAPRASIIELYGAAIQALVDPR